MSRWLPTGWRQWCWLAALGVLGLVAFAALERRGSPNTPVTVGALVAFALVLALGSAGFGDRRWSGVALLALWAAVVPALATFVEAAPAGSASCDASSDCDTSFGLGAPFLVAFYWLPAFLVAAIGARPTRQASASELRYISPGDRGSGILLACPTEPKSRSPRI